MDDNSKAKKIAPQLAKLREQSGLNPRQFAIQNNIDPSQYNKAERGEKSLGLEKIMDLATTSKVSLQWLLTGEDDTTSKKKDTTADIKYNVMLELLVRAAADAVVAAKESAIASKESAIATREATTATNTAMNMLSNSSPAVVSRIAELEEKIVVERVAVEALEATLFDVLAQKGVASASVLRSLYNKNVGVLLSETSLPRTQDETGKKDKVRQKGQAVSS